MKYQSSSTHCSKVISKIEVFKKRVKLQGQGHRVKNNGTHRKVLSQGIFRLKVLSSSTHCSRVISKDFKKMVQTPRSRSHSKQNWYPQKGLITGNIYVKYQSISTHCSKVISKVKVSERRTEGQHDRIFDLGGIKIHV